MKTELYLFNIPIEISQSNIPCKKAFGVLIKTGFGQSLSKEAKRIVTSQIAINDWISETPEVMSWCMKNNAIKLDQDRYVLYGVDTIELEDNEVPYSFLSRSEGKVFKTGVRGLETMENGAETCVPPEFLEDFDLSDRNLLMMKSATILPSVNDFTNIGRTLWLTNWKTYNKLINRQKPDWQKVDNPSYIDNKGDLPF